MMELLKQIGRALGSQARSFGLFIRKSVGRAGRFIFDLLGLDAEARWRFKSHLVAYCPWCLRGTGFLQHYHAQEEWRDQWAGQVYEFAKSSALPQLATAVDGLPDVFIWGVIDWYFRFQRPQQLARELSRRGYRVFYISPEIRKGSEGDIAVRRIDDNLVIYSVILVSSDTPSIYADALTGPKADALAVSVRRLLAWVRPRASISVVDHPGWLHLAGLPPNQRLVYDWMDNHQGFRGTADELVDAERELLRRADLTIVTSRWLLNAAKGNTRKLLLLRNACEFEHFNQPPDEIYQNPDGQRVVGYYGAIAEWFDVELVRKLASRFSDAQVLLIGADSANVGDALRDLPNVQMTGELPYAELPRYLHGMDVCLIPFIVSPLTIATDPVKAYEYLAAGKPVVSTALPELREAGLDKLVTCCEDDAQFLNAIEVALAEHPDTDVRFERIERARSESWHERGSRLVLTLEGLSDPLVSVIVVTWNNLDLTRACVESLYADLSWPHFELIVVDNGSQDGTSAWLREESKRRPRMRVILNEDNRGFAAANNQGLEIASGEYLALLNNDTIVTEGWSRQLVAHLRRNPEIGIIGPITNNIGNEARVAMAYSTVEAMPEEARSLTLARAGITVDIDVLGFFCVMFPRDVYEKVGPLDEGFGIGFFEDDDYCRRIRATGKRVVCAEDVFVHHELSASFRKVDKNEREELFNRNRLYFESKWGEWKPHVYRPRRGSAFRSSR